jgi:hypothetical protein
MPAPSFADLVDHVPSEWPNVQEWLGAHATDEPLDVVALLDLTYRDSDLEDEEHESLVEWFEAATAWGLLRLIENDGIDAERWCREAVREAWTVWQVPAAHAAAVVAVAVDPSATKEAIAGAKKEYDAWSTHGPPPPYVGHFHGALASLLRYRLERTPSEAAECLVRACVGTDGQRRSAAIAATSSL